MLTHEERNYEFPNTHSCVLFSRKKDVNGVERPRLYVQCMDAYSRQLELSIEYKHRAGSMENLFWEVHAYRHPGVRQRTEVSEKVATELIEHFLELCDSYTTLLFNNYKIRFEPRRDVHVVDRPLNEGFVHFHTQLLDGAKPSKALLK